MKIKIIAVPIIPLLLGFTHLGTAQQQPVKNARIGILGAMSGSGFADRLGVFREQLREMGYLEGKNIKFEERWAEGKLERLGDLALELVALRVDVMVTFGGSAPVFAAKKATASIPVVMAAGGSDPAASGLVASLARPGANVTGMANSFTELRGKQMEILKETIPKLLRVAVLWNPDSPSSDAGLRATES
ncbi:MAG TPA: ABC transporter substrate-binding protein, partial [Candidatus Limnocylindria bacterium]|nr:ABC transporter substrate-binding protein [Candidatus Limnocylindria bacterium]